MIEHPPDAIAAIKKSRDLLQSLKAQIEQAHHQLNVSRALIDRGHDLLRQIQDSRSIGTPAIGKPASAVDVRHPPARSNR